MKSTLQSAFKSSCGGDTVIPIKNIRKMRFREFELLPGGHKVSGWYRVMVSGSLSWSSPLAWCILSDIPDMKCSGGIPLLIYLYSSTSL